MNEVNMLLCLLWFYFLTTAGKIVLIGQPLVTARYYRDKSFCNAKLPQKIPWFTHNFRLDDALAFPFGVKP